MSLNSGWKDDYSKYERDYKSLQKEIKQFVKKIKKKHSENIDVYKIVTRPRNQIKTITSIESNDKRPKRYKKVKSVFDIKDIAGVRVICHCEDDVDNLAIVLEGELRQKQDYSNIDVKEIGGKGAEYPYRAKHVTFSKESKNKLLYCEIQIRTVMADAWAVQNHKYVYKHKIEGEAHELTNAVSEIMTGCEKLWSLVKKKSLGEEELKTPPELERIKERTRKQVAQLQDVSQKNINEWLNEQSKKAGKEIEKQGISTYMEVLVGIKKANKIFSKRDLKDSAKESTISTFGWPIALFLNNREEFRPVVQKEGIKAVVPIERRDMDKKKTFDYWAIHQSASFYTLKSIFEDLRNPKIISFNTRIVRITEVFMYLRNLYSKLGLGLGKEFKITVKHRGIKGRKLSTLSQNRFMTGVHVCNEDLVETTKTTSIEEFEESPATVVKYFTEPLFEYFDFFELEDKILKKIVANYLNGKVT